MGELRDDIEKYLRGELTPSEMHALEKKALSDPFLADALEGASSIGHQDFSKDVDELNRSLHKKKNVLFTPLRIAAGIIVVIGVSLFFVLSPSQEQQQLAQEKTSGESAKETKAAETKENATAPASDSTTHAITEPPPVKQGQQLTLAEKRKTSKRKQAEPATTRPEEAKPTLESGPTVTSRFKEDTTRSADSRMAMKTEAAKEETKTTHVSGSVISSDDGLPLPGVSVVVKGTNEGTVTDTNGNYSIEVPDSSALTFSFVGMHTNEVRATGSGNIDVRLSEDVSQLSEVLITRSPMPKNHNETPLLKLAEPVGGLRAYDKYMEDNKRYPQQALDNDVKGRVVVGFDVGVNGEIANFVVIRSLGYGCDDEVIRLVKEGPQWRPTTEDDKPVESTVQVKMKFDAGKFKKSKKK